MRSRYNIYVSQAYQCERAGKQSHFNILLILFECHITIADFFVATRLPEHLYQVIAERPSESAQLWIALHAKPARQAE